MADFHFIRPLWFIAFFVLAFVFYLLKRLRVSSSGWQQVLPKHLADNLLGREEKSKPQSLFIPMLIGTLAIVALAGPTWQKLPQPVFNTERGSVIVMDMSNSMYSTDLSPNRLTRSRYKASDLLEQINEGDIGLIAYAGDAFVISPLTKDINNIELLLPALSPALMPEQGSNPYLALLMANDMLTNAGHIEGDIYWFTDGVDHYDVEDISDFSAKHPHRLNILGVGTAQGAPIKMPNGQLLKDDRGAIVVPPLTIKQLKGLSGGGSGTYRTISVDSSDIEALVSNAEIRDTEKKKEEQLAQGDQWAEAGPYLVLLILPFVLFYFRRGLIVAMIPTMMLLQPAPAYAQEQETAPVESSFWQNLWQTKDQQAQQRFNQEDYAGAAQQFENSMWQGSAHYNNGDYEQALGAFSQSESAEALYNQGNSLAKLNKLDEALNAYDQALAKNPNLEAAKANKQLIEQLKQQQQQQQNQGQGEDQQDQSDSQEQNQDQQGQQDGEQQSGENGEQQQSSDQNQQNSSQENGQQGEQSKQDSERQDQSSSQPGEESNDQADQEQQAEAQAQNESSENAEQQAQALKAQQEAQEQEQKHQQMLNKVTDDPYLLLRNKMQLEYQKRRHQNTGDKKKW